MKNTKNNNFDEANIEFISKTINKTDKSDKEFTMVERLSSSKVTPAVTAMKKSAKYLIDWGNIFMNKEKFVEQFEKASSEPIPAERRKEIIQNSYGRISNCNNILGSSNLLIVMEEFAELQKEISKFLRNKGDRISLIEELADVALNIEYIKNICKISDEELTKAINVKLERQNKRNTIKVWEDKYKNEN